MSLSKIEAIALTPENWVYVGVWGNHYHYQRGNYKTGFYIMSLLDEDMTPSNIDLMVKLGATRIINQSHTRA